MKNDIARQVFCSEQKGWVSAAIGTVNANVVSARVMDNVEAKFHTHSDNDEFFLVLKGELEIDIEDATFTLQQGESLVVASGKNHRARARQRAEVITVISSGAPDVQVIDSCETRRNNL